jgi:predicted GNAT family acetyltransferase
MQQNSSKRLKSNEHISAGELTIRVDELDGSNKQEVVQFLSQRPIHTVHMIEFINDNGLVSPLNDSTFYGCRNRERQLEGVALIGDSTLLETTTDRATQALAEVAKTCATAHVITGEKERINNFWDYYADAGQGMRHAHRELLFELKWPIQALPEVSDLRLATPDDLELVATTQSQMTSDEAYPNPLRRETEDVRQRCARFIEQRRTWVAVQDNVIIFKADVTFDTSSVIYLDRVCTNSDRRPQSYALRCMSQLARTLLRRTDSVCVLVNENDKKAHKFYRLSGYKLRSIYETIFLTNQP